MAVTVICCCKRRDSQIALLETYLRYLLDSKSSHLPRREDPSCLEVLDVRQVMVSAHYEFPCSIIGDRIRTISDSSSGPGDS